MHAHLLDDLHWRGLLVQCSDNEGLRGILSAGSEHVYCGFDPTADSLHVGSLVPVLTLARYQRAGHVPVVVLGGATGLIGDPSGKTTERTLNSNEVVQHFLDCMRRQIAPLIDLTGPRAAKIVNNYDWTVGYSAIDFLRDIGKHFTVNFMMAKDSVQSRLDRDGVGISYTEFSYMLLQSLDFYHLAKDYGCRVQIGGSDQWGNMTAGIELIRRKIQQQAYVMTMPLVTTADGRKFGKTEAGAVWLDPNKTSPYAFYQFWLNTDDRDVVKFLKYYTFLSVQELEELEAELTSRPELRSAQRRLAAELTRLIHGETELEKVIRAAEALFGGGDLREIDARTLEAAVSSAPSQQFDRLEDLPDLLQLLVDGGLATSRGEARKNLTGGGIYVNNQRIGLDFKPGIEDLLHGRLLILRRGKKNYAIVRVGG